MKTKIKFVSMTFKVALLGMMAFAFVACGESKESTPNMSKEMDKQWEDYAKNLDKSDKIKTLQEQYLFYSCTVFDGSLNAQNEKFKECKMKLELRGSEPINYENLAKSYDSKCKDKSKLDECLLGWQEKWTNSAKMLARYKYDKKFSENELTRLYEELWSLLEPLYVPIMLEVGVYKDDDKSIEDGKKLLATMIGNTLNAGLEYYKVDTYNTPFNFLVRKSADEITNSKEFKETLATCEKERCGTMSYDDQMVSMFGGFELTKYGQCVRKSKLSCVTKAFDSYKFMPFSEVINHPNQIAINCGELFWANIGEHKTPPQCFIEFDKQCEEKGGIDCYFAGVAREVASAIINLKPEDELYEKLRNETIKFYDRGCLMGDKFSCNAQSNKYHYNYAIKADKAQSEPAVEPATKGTK